MMQKKFILFGTGMSLFLALLLVITSCKKEVEPFELIGPDYSIEKVEYTTDNNALNDLSQVVVKVDVKNSGLLDPLGTFLYIYKNGEYLFEKRIEPMETGEVRTIDFTWDAIIGEHIFDLKVDITPNNESLIKENNEGNNTASLTLDVELLQRQIVNQEEVEPEIFEEEVDQEDDAVVEIVEFLEAENLGTSPEGQYIKTEFDQEGTVNYTMSLHNPDGSIDETKVLQINVFEAPDGTTVQVPMVTEKGTGDEYFLYDENVRIRVTNGGTAFEIIEGGFLKEDCTEPGMMVTAITDPNLPDNLGFDCQAEAAATTTTYEDYLDEVASCNLAANMIGPYSYAEIDNEATITYAATSWTEGCYSCNGSTKVNYRYPIYTITYEDDRGIEVQTATTFNPTCSGNVFNASVTDCGGNVTEIVIVPDYAEIGTEENSADCHDQGGN